MKVKFCVEISVKINVRHARRPVVKEHVQWATAKKLGTVKSLRSSNDAARKHVIAA